MRYICTEDIENLAAQGKKELIVDENTVVLDLARDMARQLGVALLDGSQPAAPKAGSPAVSPSSSKAASPAASPSPTKAGSPASPATASNGTAPHLGAKPKGCQHGPFTVAARQEHTNGHQNSDGVVDQLVELVRQSVGKHTGN